MTELEDPVCALGVNKRQDSGVGVEAVVDGASANVNSSMSREDTSCVESDSGKHDSCDVDDDEEEEDRELVLKDIDPEPMTSLSSPSNNTDIKRTAPCSVFRRIPTLIYDEAKDECKNDDELHQIQQTSHVLLERSDTQNRRSSRLSKQCVVDDETNLIQEISKVHVKDDVTNENKSNVRPSAPQPKTEDQEMEVAGESNIYEECSEMDERRRLLAGQLSSRTRLTLSRSVGSIGMAKCLTLSRAKSACNDTPSTNVPAISKTSKQLIRSHAMCGDDDTRLRPPPEFTRSNPIVFSQQHKSLSRDSSATDYTDSSGVDLYAFICATLHKNPKDRRMLLDIEKHLRDFLEDESKQSHKFPVMSSYNRMLLHRVAAYFGLDHNVDQSGQCIVVNRSDNTRIPDQNFTSLIQEDFFTDTRHQSLHRDVQSFDEMRDLSTQNFIPVSDSCLSRRARSFEVAATPTELTYAVNNSPTTSFSFISTANPVPCHTAYGHPMSSEDIEYREPLICEGVDSQSHERLIFPAGYGGTRQLQNHSLEAGIGNKNERNQGGALMQKSGSFGGVPVFYRANSNGVRPVEEMRTIDVNSAKRCGIEASQVLTGRRQSGKRVNGEHSSGARINRHRLGNREQTEPVVNLQAERFDESKKSDNSVPLPGYYCSPEFVSPSAQAAHVQHYTQHTISQPTTRHSIPGANLVYVDSTTGMAYPAHQMNRAFGQQMSPSQISSTGYFAGHPVVLNSPARPQHVHGCPSNVSVKNRGEVMKRETTIERSGSLASEATASFLQQPNLSHSNVQPIVVPPAYYPANCSTCQVSGYNFYRNASDGCSYGEPHIQYQQVRPSQLPYGQTYCLPQYMLPSQQPSSPAYYAHMYMSQQPPVSLVMQPSLQAVPVPYENYGRYQTTQPSIDAGYGSIDHQKMIRSDSFPLHPSS